MEFEKDFQRISAICPKEGLESTKFTTHRFEKKLTFEAYLETPVSVFYQLL